MLGDKTKEKVARSMAHLCKRGIDLGCDRGKLPLPQEQGRFRGVRHHISERTGALLKTISEQNAYDTFWNALIFTIAALKAWPEAIALADPVAAHIHVGESLNAELRVLLQRTAELSALAERLDYLLDNDIRSVHIDALQFYRQDRKAEGFRYLFRENIAATTRFALAAQRQVGVTLYERLSAPQYEGNLSRHRDALRARLEDAEALLSERRGHDLLVELHRQRIQAWKAAANLLREQTYGELIKLGGATGRDFADRFFA